MDMNGSVQASVSALQYVRQCWQNFKMLKDYTRCVTDRLDPIIALLDRKDLQAALTGKATLAVQMQVKRINQRVQDLQAKTNQYSTRHPARQFFAAAVYVGKLREMMQSLTDHVMTLHTALGLQCMIGIQQVQHNMSDKLQKLEQHFMDMRAEVQQELGQARTRQAQVDVLRGHGLVDSSFHPDELQGLFDDLQQDIQSLKDQKERTEAQYLEQIAALLVTHQHSAAPPDYPTHLQCSICLDVFKDPVVLGETGHTYCRCCITKWLVEGTNTDPQTGSDLKFAPQLTANILVRQLVEQFCTQNLTEPELQSKPKVAASAQAHAQQDPRTPSFQASSEAGAAQNSDGSNSNIVHLVQQLQSIVSAVQQQAADALGTLACCYPDNRTAIAREGAIPHLVRLLQSNVSGVQENAANALGHLACDHPDNRTAIARAGAIPHLVRLLQSSASAVQQWAAYALGHLAYWPDNPTTIARAGAIPHLVRLLQSSVSAVQESAACALGNLASHHTDDIARAGAIPHLIRLLQSSVSAVQESAARALGNLARNYYLLPTTKTIAREGAIPHLVRLLQSTDSAVQQQAAFALGKLAFHFTDNQTAIARAGAIPHLVRLLQSNGSAVQHSAAYALDHLACDHPDNRTAIANEGAIPHLVRLLQSSASDVQQRAARALGNLAIDPTNRKVMARAGAVPLLKYLRKHGVSSGVCDDAEHALSRFSWWQ